MSTSSTLCRGMDSRKVGKTIDISAYRVGRAEVPWPPDWNPYHELYLSRALSPCYVH